MNDARMLELWRSLPSDYKQFDELVLAFGRLVQAEQPIHVRERWNIEPQDDGSLLICENNHDKGEKCEYVRYVVGGTASGLSRETIASIAGAVMETGRHDLFMAMVDSALSTITPCVKTDIALQSDSDKASELLSALKEVRKALQFANDTPNGGICDTLWMTHGNETIFDYIDSVLADERSAPEFDSQDAPLTDDLFAAINAVVHQNRLNGVFTSLSQAVDRLEKLALLAQVKQPKTDLGNDDNALAGDAVAPQSNGSERNGQ